MKDYAVLVVFKKEILILTVLAYAEFQENNWKQKKKLSVSIVDAKDVLVEVELFLINYKLF